MKIIVLTPVKNEIWILERFLRVTSEFADHIIVIDQNSTDGSLDIYPKFPKVTLLKNPSEKYDEAERQLTLIAKARELEPGPKILLALDADELLAANALDSMEWKTMLQSKPGTILYFEKPDLFLGTSKVIRYAYPWPIGYVDDGVAHKPIKIHSIRIPQPPYAKKLILSEIKIIHYGISRFENQMSKSRFYSMNENIMKKNNFLARRYVYTPKYDFIGKNRLENVPEEWYNNWKEKGIDMTSIELPPYYWYDDEVVKLFRAHGSYKFWLDNVWEKDWNNYIRERKLSPEFKVSRPPFILLLLLKYVDKLFKVWRKIKNS